MEPQYFTLKDVMDREIYAQHFTQIRDPNGTFADYIGTMDICLFFPWYPEEATDRKIYLKVFAHMKNVHFQTQVMIGSMDGKGIYELKTKDEIAESLNKMHFILQKKSMTFAFKAQAFFYTLFNWL